MTWSRSEKGGDGACGECPDVVAAGSAGFVDELFAPQFTGSSGNGVQGMAWDPG